MTIAEILNQEQQIWNHQKLSLSQIIIRMGKVLVIFANTNAMKNLAIA